MLVCEWVNQILLSYPISLDLSAWWAPGTVFTLLLPVLLAVYGLRVALAGQPLFKTTAFRE